MANCMKCGAPLREGARFCSACGAPVEVAPLFCDQCGARLESGDSFCLSCGAPVRGVAPAAQAPRRRGRPPKVRPDGTAAKPIKAQKPLPDQAGFYLNSNYSCVTSEAAVFTDGHTIFRVDKDWNVTKTGDEPVFVEKLLQQDGKTLCLSRDHSDESASLKLVILDEGLHVVEERELCTFPQSDDIQNLYTMDLQHAFLLSWTPVEDDALGNSVSSEITLRRFDLETGEETVFSLPNRVDSAAIDFNDYDRILTDGGRLYLQSRLCYLDEDGDVRQDDAWLVLDADAGRFSVLWRGSGMFDSFGKPLFFDFARGVMWTYPRELEMKRRGWWDDSKWQAQKKYLVARKIAPDAPILANRPDWVLPDSDCWGGYLSYFDGEHAYTAPSYFMFFALNQYGGKSEDWNKSGHGRPETAVIWPQKGKILMDLLADYYYSVYPMVDYAPDRTEVKKLDDMRSGRD